MRHPKKHIDFLTWQSLIKQSTKRDVLSTSEHDVTDTCPTLHVKYRERVEGPCIQRGGGGVINKKNPDIYLYPDYREYPYNKVENC